MTSLPDRYRRAEGADLDRTWQARLDAMDRQAARGPVGWPVAGVWLAIVCGCVAAWVGIVALIRAALPYAADALGLLSLCVLCAAVLMLGAA